MNPRTHAILVLDCSHSMKNTKEQALSECNDALRIWKEKAKEGHDIRFSLFTFCGQVFEHVWDRPIEEVEPFQMDDYVLKDWTAFYDAVGHVAKRAYTEIDLSDEQTAVLINVVTDGDSNKDSVFNCRKNAADSSAMRELIGACLATKKFTFSILGPHQYLLSEIHQHTGIVQSNMAVWNNVTAEAATYGMKMSNARSAQYFEDRSKGMTTKLDYMSDQIGVAANFVPPSTSAGLPDPAPGGSDILRASMADLSRCRPHGPTWVAVPQAMESLADRTATAPVTLETVLKNYDVKVSPNQKATGTKSFLSGGTQVQ